MNYLMLLGGFVLLIAAGELLVRGAAGMALKAKIPPLVVGLTVVSLGTSSPELFASLQAALAGNVEIAVGNVLGSNIANLGLVLGITALIFPIAIDRDLIRRDWPVLMVASLLFYALGHDGELSVLDGIFFLVLLVAFITYLVVQSRRRRAADLIKSNDPVSALSKAGETQTTEAADDEFETYGHKSGWVLVALVAGGCVGLYFGAEWFVSGAVGIAEDFGVSKHIIAVTVIAFGTSVPELAASAMAAYRRQTDISVGNLVGSNILNILCVLGVTSTTVPLAVGDNVLQFDMWWMLGIVALLLPIMLIKRRISRLSGALFLLAYVAYIFFLVSGSL